MSKKDSQSTQGGEGNGKAGNRVLRARRSRPAFYVMLILIALSAGSFTLYYFSHANELREYYLRSLLVSTDNAEQEIERLNRNFQKTLKYKEDESSKKTERFDTGAQEFFDAKISLIPAFENISDKFCHSLLAVAKDKSQAGRPGSDSDGGQPDQAQPLAANTGKTESETITLAGWQGSDAVLCLSSSDELGTTLTSPPARLAGLLEPVLPVDDFDSVLLIRQDGEVLLLQQHQTMAIDVVRLDISELRDFEHIASEEKTPAPELELEHTAIGEFSFAEQQYLAFIQPLRIPVDINWISTSTSSDEQTWFLIGLKEEGRFRAEAMAISPTAMLAILSLVILALFALPYLKLRFIGSREALHKHDILVLSITLMVALSCITLALLELHMRDVWQDHIDERLNLVADNISESFDEEVKSIAMLLGGLTKNNGQLSSVENQSRPYSLTNVLAKAESADSPELPESILKNYPFFEMVYWMDVNGEQIDKWTIKATSTPLISVKDREYFTNAHELNFTNSASIEELEHGWALESIRSKNTGEVSGVVSLNSGEQGFAAVAAAYTPLLSVIEPVLPPGFQFAVINDQGDVLFHQDPSRNLSENLFEWVDKEDALRAAVWSGNNWPELDLVYRAKAYRAHLRPLDPTPWSLVVFYDVRDSRLARVDILTVAFLFYLIYLIVIFLMYFYLWARTRETMKNPFFIWLWPSRDRVHVYVGSILIAGICALVWALLLWQSTRTGFIGQTSYVVLSALLGLVTFGFFYKLMRLSNSETLRFVGADGTRSQFRSVPWYVLTMIVAMLAWPELISKEVAVTAGMVTGLLVLLHFIAVQFSYPFKTWRPSWTSSQWLHLASLCAVGGVIAVLPLFMFYGVAHDEITALAVKRDQVNWSISLSSRHQKHVDRYQKIAMHNSSEKQIKDLLQLAVGSELADAWDIHGVEKKTTEGAGFTAIELSEAGHCGNVGKVKSSAKQPVPTSKAMLFAASLIPGYTAESYELRSLASAEVNEEWCWNLVNNESLEFTRERYRNDIRFGQHDIAETDLKYVGLQLGTPLSFFAPPTIRDKTWILAVLVLLLLVGINKNLLRYVYLMDLKFAVFLSGNRWPNTADRRHRLVLRGSDRHRKTPVDTRSYHTIDTTHIESDEVAERLLEQAIGSGKEAVCLNHFHLGLWDAEVANRKLMMLERLLTSGIQLEVRSDINPMHFFLMRSRDYLRGYADTDPDLGRWSAVLAEFTRCRPSRDTRKNQANLLSRLRKERPAHGIEKTTTALKLLADECCSHHELEEIAITIARHPGFEELAFVKDFPDSLINQVLDQADPYYRLLWAISSKDERMVLYHVAVNGFISWRSSDVLRRLVYRGLVEMAPHPRVMNRSFWLYVQNAEMPEVLEQWTAEAGASGWARLKAPLLVTIALAVVFLLSTQPQLLRQGIAFTAILAAGAPALIKLFSMVAQTRLWGSAR